MTDTRITGIAGLCFPVALVVGVSLQPSLDFDAAAPEFARQLSAGEGGLLASGVAMAVAAVALHWFLAALRDALDPGARRSASAILGPAGAVAGALLALGFLGVAALAAWSPQGGGDPAALQAAARLANAATNVALLPLAAAGLAVAMLDRRPAWIAGLGVLAAAASVVAAGRAVDELAFLALLLWMIWSAGLGIGLLRRDRTRGAVPAAA